MTSHQEIWVLADPQFSVQHVVNIHTGGRTAHMTIIAQCVISMTMPHTCVRLCTRANTMWQYIKEADSFDHSNTFRVSSTISEITEADVNEVSHGWWNNNSNYSNRQDNKYWNKQDGYKGKKDFDKKPWHNKDQKSWNKDQKSQYSNKGTKPKDACITVTKDVKYFCPTAFVREFSMQ